MKLNVPYRSQLDNVRNPYGSCNVTSLAMGMLYYGVKERPAIRLEDELYNYCEFNGFSRHSPYDLAVVFNQFSRKAGREAFSNFSIWGTIAKIKDHINSGHPVITHGWFTNFGHIIVIVGYNLTGFIVHDPYGEYYSWGYRLNSSANPQRGKNLVYSYRLMERYCHDASDGTWWVHYLSGVKPNYHSEIKEPLVTFLSGVRLQDIIEQQKTLDVKDAINWCPGLVTQIQICLANHLGECPGKRDGIFGAMTTAAYQRAMRKMGLSISTLGVAEAIALIQGNK